MPLPIGHARSLPAQTKALASTIPRTACCSRDGLAPALGAIQEDAAQTSLEPLSLEDFKLEQHKTKADIAAAEKIIAKWSIELDSITTSLDEALSLMIDLYRLFIEAPDHLRFMLAKPSRKNLDHGTRSRTHRHLPRTAHPGGTPSRANQPTGSARH